MLARNIFNSLIGEWTFTRHINNRLVQALSGLVTGTVSLTKVSENELHYHEEGEYETEGGKKSKVHHDYFYVYDPQQDQIAKHFSIDGNRGGLFYLLQLRKDATENIVTGTADTHVCSQDKYTPSYTFEGPAFSIFRLSYSVSGPLKDYTTETTFIRATI